MKRALILPVATILALILSLAFPACRGAAEKPSAPPSSQPTQGGSLMDVVKAPFGVLPDGRSVEIYTLTNAHGLKARIMTYGAILVSLDLPDRTGALADCVLGYDTLDGYLKTTPYFGAIVGRYGNRIAKGRFTLDGIEYKLATNNGANHLHGGDRGFDKVLWTAEPFLDSDSAGVALTYLSPDGEEGYPGNLKARVTYELTGADELRIEYEITTDKATPVNLTHHSYFNFTAGKRDILGHELMIAADQYTPVDAGLIPTGELRAVAGTPMDFTAPAAIGSRIAQVEGGYDHNYVLRTGGARIGLAARVVEPESGRVMEISTTEPGHPVLLGQFPGRDDRREGRPGLRQALGLLPRDPAFPRFAEQAGFPEHDPDPGTRLYLFDRP